MGLFLKTIAIAVRRRHVTGVMLNLWNVRPRVCSFPSGWQDALDQTDPSLNPKPKYWDRAFSWWQGWHLSEFWLGHVLGATAAGNIWTRDDGMSKRLKGFEPLHWGIIRYHGHSRGCTNTCCSSRTMMAKAMLWTTVRRARQDVHSVGIARIYTWCVCNFSNISRACIFFLLTPSLIFYSSLLWFLSLHIVVGRLTSKLPSIVSSLGGRSNVN